MQTPSPKRKLPRTQSPVSTETIVLADGRIRANIAASPTSAPGDGIALLIDRAACAFGELAAAADGGLAFDLPLPQHIVGGTLDVLSISTGRSVLQKPVALAEAQGLCQTEIRCTLGVVEGSFAFSGKAARHNPDPAIPIQVRLTHDNQDLAIGFARWTDGKFRFRIQLPVLGALNGVMQISVKLGTTTLDKTLELRSGEYGYVGYVDPATASAVRGWVASLAKPGRPVELELLLDGVVAAKTRANIPRPDLMELGLGNGRSGFQLPLPKSINRLQPVSVGVVIAGTSMHLQNSPMILPALPRRMGYFDTIEGLYAHGWAANIENPGVPLVVEAVCDGKVIASTTANTYRGDLADAGIPIGRCGFNLALGQTAANLVDKDIYLRIAGDTQALEGSPRRVSLNNNIVRHIYRNALLDETVRDRLARHLSHRNRAIGISIIMPVYNTPQAWLIEALNSVLQQWSGNWELICVDDGSTAEHVATILDAASRQDPRIRVLRPGRNLGIAKATNFGLRAARGKYTTFLDHDDVLEPDAIHSLSQAALETGADLIYSDEALTSESITDIVHVVARPAFSYDYYLSHPYFVHMICVNTELAQRVNGWDEDLSISADVDFVLRILEKARKIAHVPKVLYRWRTHATSTGHLKAAEVMETMLGSLGRHLQRQGLNATPAAGLHHNNFRIDWTDDGGEVMIVIPTKNRVDLLKPCIDSIEKTCGKENIRIVVIDHASDDLKTRRYLRQIQARHTVMPYEGIFNYARMNNAAVKLHGGTARYVLFMNNDVEAIDPGWISRMRSLAARNDVGAVGPLLLYADRRVQHAGVLMAFNGAADHVGKFEMAYNEETRQLGYNCLLTSVRDYSAVTAACIMIRRSVFEAVSGFDERFVIGFNDTDLCLRIAEAGYKVLYDGQTVLFHHESATRSQSNEVLHPEDDARLRTRWKRYFDHGDPFYSPLLNQRGTDHVLRTDAGCRKSLRTRSATLSEPGQPAPSAVPLPRKKAPAKRAAR